MSSLSPMPRGPELRPAQLAFDWYRCTIERPPTPDIYRRFIRSTDRLAERLWRVAGEDLTQLFFSPGMARLQWMRARTDEWRSAGIADRLKAVWTFDALARRFAPELPTTIGRFVVARALFTWLDPDLQSSHEFQRERDYRRSLIATWQKLHPGLSGPDALPELKRDCQLIQHLLQFSQQR